MAPAGAVMWQAEQTRICLITQLGISLVLALKVSHPQARFPCCMLVEWAMEKSASL